jgi:hypothetical protein
MPSLTSAVLFVVLHTGAEVTLTAYLVRGLVYLVAFTGVGVATVGGLRAIELVRSETTRRGGIAEDEP